MSNSKPLDTQIQVQELLQQMYLHREGDNVAPVSPLDNFLILKELTEYRINIYNILNGECLDTKEKIDKFHTELIELANKNEYKTTDHLIYSIEIDTVVYLYVSLDNSVRSNMNSKSLAHNRLDNLLGVVKIILDNNPKTVVFFSESCRPSFNGGINQRKDEVSWLKMRRRIKEITGLDFLVEKRNNEDYVGLSFGISVWITELAIPHIDNYYSKELLNLGFGSVAVGIKSIKNKIVWGVHFPIDFKNTGDENHGAITMKNLIKLMNEYPGSVCALGDMNTIPGMINDSIRKVVKDNSDKYELLLDSDTLTFFGSYYDTVPISALGPNPLYLTDVPDERKYGILRYVGKRSFFLFSSNFNQSVDNLPNSIIKLILPNNYDLELNLPSSIL
jgi:hypothetical protein